MYKENDSKEKLHYNKFTKMELSTISNTNDLLNTSEKVKKIAKWYFGGLASAGAATFTHPLDLLKVLLQTKGETKGNLISTTFKIINQDGVLALYNGLSASLLRQLTYSTIRFGIYESSKQYLYEDNQIIPFYQKVFLASVSGSIGGFLGSPADMINVRMQNDVKLSNCDRRNYKHAIDGIYQVWHKEGFNKLFNGATMATIRAMLVSIGQLSMYDQYKYLLTENLPKYFKDDTKTFFLASLMAGASATTITQPLDVMKTRLMNAKQDEYKSILNCFISIYKEKGILGFFKGYIPAFIRLAPHTILTFIFFEKLRINFGTFK